MTVYVFLVLDLAAPFDPRPLTFKKVHPVEIPCTNIVCEFEKVLWLIVETITI